MVSKVKVQIIVLVSNVKVKIIVLVSKVKKWTYGYGRMDSHTIDMSKA